VLRAANIGEDSELYRTRGAAHLLLFEPLDSNLKELHAKFDRMENVEIFPFGLGNGSRTATIQFSADARNIGAAEVRAGTTVTGDTVQMEIRDVADNLRAHIPDGGQVFLTINCEGCEFETLGRLAAYDQGNFLRNGTIQQVNVALHEEFARERGALAVVDYCTALPLLHRYYRQTYCAGPWAGWVYRGADEHPSQ
jgi:FkbM family methyltransferase